MSDLLGLTSSEKVRASMGLSGRDLPDAVMDQMDIADELQVVLESWLPDWESHLATGAAEAASAVEKGLLRTLRVYAKYQAAAILAVSAQNFVLERLSDGENEGQRNLEGIAGYRHVLQSKADEHRVLIENVLDSQRQADLVLTLFGVSVPDRDPVTEGRG